MAGPIIREERIGSCRLIQGDCLEVMPMLGKVDLCLTDAPYGIGADEKANAAALLRIKANGKSKAGRGWALYKASGWDRERPDKSSFDMAINKSREQVFWGGNYFTDYLPPTMRWLIWDKGQRDFSLSDFEMAWTSQKKASRIFDYPRALAIKDGKRHPTQKPVALMEWCLGFFPDEQRLDDAIDRTTGNECPS